MAATYEPIASTTLGSDTANIEWTSIPGSFTDLRAIYVVRGTHSANSVTGNLTFNGETSGSTLHSATWLYGTGSSAVSGRVSSGIMQFPDFYAATSTSGRWSVITVDVMSYANTNVYKTVLIATTTPDYYVARTVGLFRSTSAVTAFSFQGNGGNLLAGTTASLYGIKAA